jgi:hypothetical protein
MNLEVERVPSFVKNVSFIFYFPWAKDGISPQSIRLPSPGYIVDVGGGGRGGEKMGCKTKCHESLMCQMLVDKIICIVPQGCKALCCKPEGRGFKSR